MTQIGRCAFAQNDNVTKIIIPAYITKICDDAFWMCSNLKEVIIEKADTPLIVNNGAFFNCPNLERIIVGREMSWNTYSINRKVTKIVEIE